MTVLQYHSAIEGRGRASTGNGNGAESTRPDDDALVRVVLDPSRSVSDRLAAAESLALAPGLPTRVVAISVGKLRDPVSEVISLIASALADTTRFSVIAGTAALLVQGGPTADTPSEDLRTALRRRSLRDRRSAGVRIGVGGTADIREADVSWDQARLALRFAALRDAAGHAGDPAEAVVDYDALGPLTVLAHVPATHLRADADVAALNALMGSASGVLDIVALEAFCRTGSLRQAAQVLYLHHSTVASRLARIEAALGWRLDEPGDRFRAQLALWVRRLAHE